ncbi:caspase family protein [Agrococcus jenensis]|uniref:Putative peptidoglycan binding protein n=1 Tax=Agrococcus jenensis TaxID=46353 RepID=A0A3N2AS50_9MICO|nr:caspase family protein [Agrococcus jenensis]ROR65873.1 putative peptidoglycan binding protein [Agrococcus jenensis]
MFQSRRFTTVATRSTQDRLLDAQSNARPIVQGESHRGAVVAIQEALCALNSGYIPPNGIDGYFGPRTFAAVDAFQREYGLIADGIVGMQTLTQLDALFSGDVVRTPVGVGVHVGVDRVDPAHYGSPMTLPSCGNDARAMAEIAGRLGYDTAVLLDEEATTAAFYALLNNAAVNLMPGDALLVSFSGHGSQLPNDSADLEDDGLDETTCFYDRMLLDDELNELLRCLREGVRVHLVFDSCHSGTAFKSILDAADAKDIATGHAKDVKGALAATSPQDLQTSGSVSRNDVIPITKGSLSKALDGEAPELEAVAVDRSRDDDVASLFGDLYVRTQVGDAKFADGTQVYATNKELYEAVRLVATKSGPGEPVPPTVTILSACADHQTTPAGNPLSAFTYNLTTAWAGGSFSGSYEELYRTVRSSSQPDATPQLGTHGSRGAAARVLERPFAL